VELEELSSSKHLPVAEVAVAASVSLSPATVHP